jgi:hypothetical protein
MSVPAATGPLSLAASPDPLSAGFRMRQRLCSPLLLPTGLPNLYIAQAHIELIDEPPAERAALLSLADGAKA